MHGFLRNRGDSWGSLNGLASSGFSVCSLKPGEASWEGWRQEMWI